MLNIYNNRRNNLPRMNKVKLLTDWLYSVATVAWICIIIAIDEGDEAVIILGLSYLVGSPIVYWLIWKICNIVSSFVQSKILTKHILTEVIREVEVVREVEVIKNVPSHDGIVIKNIHVQDGVYKED